MEELKIPHPLGIGPYVTASFGVATVVPGRDDDRQRLVAEADEALYRAKREGRNRVAGPLAPSPGAGA